MKLFEMFNKPVEEMKSGKPRKPRGVNIKTTVDGLRTGMWRDSQRNGKQKQNNEVEIVEAMEAAGVGLRHGINFLLKHSKDGKVIIHVVGTATPEQVAAAKEVAKQFQDVNEAFGSSRGQQLQKELVVYPNATFDKGQALRLPVGTEVGFAPGGNLESSGVAKIIADNKIWFAWSDDYYEALSTRIKEDGEESTAITPDEVIAIWKEVFPHSTAYAQRGALGGGMYFSFLLSAGRDEVSNGILENDPLHYSALLDNDGSWEENSSSMSIAPPEGSHLAFGSAKFRKKKAKNVTLDQLRTRFAKVKEFVTANADKMHQIKFDINQKLGNSVTEDDTGTGTASQHLYMVRCRGNFWGGKWYEDGLDSIVVAAGSPDEAFQIASSNNDAVVEHFHNKKLGSRKRPALRRKDNKVRVTDTTKELSQTSFHKVLSSNGTFGPVNVAEGLAEDEGDIQSKDPKVAQMLKKARINYAGRADDDLSALVSLMGDEQDVQDKELNSLDHHNNDQDIELDQEEHMNVDQEEEIMDLKTRVAKIEREQSQKVEGVNEEQLDEGILQDVFSFLWNATGKVLDSLPMVGDKRAEQRVLDEYDSFVDKMDDATISQWINELTAKIKSSHPATVKASDRRVALLRKAIVKVKASKNSSDFQQNMRGMRRALHSIEKFTKQSNRGVADRKRKGKDNSVRDFEKDLNESEHSEAVTQVLMRLQAAGGKVYEKAILQKGNETAMLAQNGNIRFAIFQDGKVKRAKKFIEFQRDGWEIEMNLGEAIVPNDGDDQDEYPYWDNETGEVFPAGQASSVSFDNEEDDDEDIDDADGYDIVDAFRAELTPSKQAQAQGMFGDIAAGGGDPVDHLMSQLGMSMEQIDVLARDNGYNDANEWAESYQALESVISSFKKLDQR